MTLLAFPDRFKVTTTTTGAGTLTLGSAVSGYQGTSALVNGTPYRYTVLDPNGVDWETGRGTYTASGTTLTRGAVTSSNSNAAISLSASGSTVLIGPVGILSESAHRVGRKQISGLGAKWTSSTTLGVATAGSVYIESLDAIVYGNPSDITPSSPSASTMYHVYAYSNSGVLTLEASTTAPVPFADPAGTARSKSGDASRRFLYSALTDGGGAFYAFDHDPTSGTFHWIVQQNASPFRVLSNGAATSGTAVDCSGLVAPGARSILVDAQMTAGGAFYLTSNATSASSSAYTYVMLSGLHGLGPCPCDATQKLNYSGPGSGCYIDVSGFVLSR